MYLVVNAAHTPVNTRAPCLSPTPEFRVLALMFCCCCRVCRGCMVALLKSRGCVGLYRPTPCAAPRLTFCDHVLLPIF